MRLKSARATTELEPKVFFVTLPQEPLKFN